MTNITVRDSEGVSELNVLNVLERLENFRMRVVKGETSGSLEWAIRMCQAHIATDYYEDRKTWEAALKSKWCGGKYQEGEIVELQGKKYRVQHIYRLTDSEMMNHNLVHRYRVKIQNLDDCADVQDFACGDTDWEFRS